MSRGVFVAAISALATGLWFGPAAAVGSSTPSHKITSHRFSETRKFIRVGTEGKPGTDSFRLITVGLVDGRIGGTSVHGAFRDLGHLIGSGREIDQGTEFDARGSRSFVQHLRLAIRNGQVTVSGTGRWTGGTGSYRHARGRFKLSGGGPLGSVGTSHLTGSIIY